MTGSGAPWGCVAGTCSPAIPGTGPLSSIPQRLSQTRDNLCEIASARRAVHVRQMPDLYHFVPLLTPGGGRPVADRHDVARVRLFRSERRVREQAVPVVRAV